MAKYIIQGGEKLFGEVTSESSKNAILPILSACVMISGEVYIQNVPKISDIITMLEILKSIGAEYSFSGDLLKIDCSKVYSYEPSQELSKKIRASVFLTGSILARFHKAVITKPGGCNIGKRPIDMHVSTLQKLGVETAENEVLFFKCDNLEGNTVKLEYKSVGVTENLILASVTANGETVIKNSAREPEIVCLANFLNLCGANIKGAGTSTIIIDGVKKLYPPENPFLPISDRIEVGTFILATLSTGGEVLINNANFNHNCALIKKISNNACKITVFNDKIYIKSSGLGKSLQNIVTAPYPYFPTDLQSQICAYATTLSGITEVYEGVFEDRFKQLNELKKMGANITVLGSKAIIQGVNTLKGANVTALDLRGGASLIIAGLKAEGITTVNNSSVIERGYLQIETKLKNLGAKIIKE